LVEKESVLCAVGRTRGEKCFAVSPFDAYTVYNK